MQEPGSHYSSRVRKGQVGIWPHESEPQRYMANEDRYTVLHEMAFLEISSTSLLANSKAARVGIEKRCYKLR